MADRQERETEVVEEGDIFFLYRPDVATGDPSGPGDVQRFFMVLRPRGGRVRLLTVGRKRLPDIGRHERNWGFVDMVADTAAEIEESLREADYGTRTRGTRHLPAARPAGEGVYAVILEDGTLHLLYALELPERPGEVQQALRIAPQASYALSVKNPEKGQPKASGLRAQDKADYPDRLQAAFRGRRFAREDVRLLDYEGAEFILVGARADPQKAYGVDLDPDREDARHADIIRRLRMAKSRHPQAALFQGKWA